MKVRIQEAHNGYIVTELEGDKNTYVYNTWQETSMRLFDWIQDIIAGAEGQTIDLSIDWTYTNE
jgi:hypothetical protein